MVVQFGIGLTRGGQREHTPHIFRKHGGFVLREAFI